MDKHSNKFGYDPQDNLASILPAVIAGMISLSITIIATILFYPPADEAHRNILIVYGITGCFYLGFYYRNYILSPNKSKYAWYNAGIAGSALGVLPLLIPVELNYLAYALVFMAALATSVISSRGPAYCLIVIVSISHFVFYLNHSLSLSGWINHIGLVISAFISVETIQQLKTISQKQMSRLEIVNEVSKQIVSTLDTKQLLALLDAELQNVLEADTYYIGLQKGDELLMELFYDDGEYFNGTNVKLEGTLANWVLQNQKVLFLADIRKAEPLEGVKISLIGKPKDSLSWMGVPMKGIHVNGVMAIASYHANAFNRSDFELLSNIAQRAALALDNTYHHALVQEQARLDSLTRVFNHGYFIQKLREQAEICRMENQHLSLIMLDIDYFKQFNDSFGHSIGDEILINLCHTIRQHIKKTDAVGRWGGEEFAISLPNTDIQQAIQVAGRIRETLTSIKINHNNHAQIPVPTISMGIAVFPEEADEIIKLIDLADQRLYTAKERGRDQIESTPMFQ
ncbi:MAG: sensor domain-containing diguanylate cyclase [Anaerolineales bacterium]|nr:sensor domain-containing diguanylate cyclase [Anaerolineales bacterium]